MSTRASTCRAFLIWFLPAIVVAVAVARVSVWVQPHFSPLVLFPLLIGTALGALLSGLLQVSHLRDAWLAVAGAIVVALVSAAAEHAFFYLDYRSAHARKAIEAALPLEELPPASFAEYMRAQAVTDRRQIPLWLTNAALIALSAAGMVGWYVKSHAQSIGPQSGPLSEGKGADTS